MRIFKLIPAIALAAALPVLAQNAPAKKNNIGSKAEQAAEEEARKAREAREARVPTLKEEDKKDFETREKVEVTNTTGKSDYENQRRKIEIKAQSKRSELIAYLDKILKQNPPEEEKPELLFQKA